jgi:hypothetical protein
MKQCRIIFLCWLILLLVVAGCLHTRVRHVQSFPAGTYSKINSKTSVPKTRTGWMVILSPQSDLSRRTTREELDLSGTEVIVRISNSSPVDVVLGGWQGGASVKLRPNQEEVVWRGVYPRKAPEYPLFWTSSRTDTKLAVEVSFTPSIKWANPLVLKMAQDPL